MKLQVLYTVEMVAEVDFDPETDDIQDSISDIDVPEGGKNSSQYVENSFSVSEVRAENDKLICLTSGKILD